MKGFPIILIFFILPSTLAQICTSDSQCALPGYHCQQSTISNYKMCLKPTIGGGVEPTTLRPSSACLTDRDCAAHQNCRMALNGQRLCQTADQVVYCLRDNECRAGEKCVLQQDRSTICQLTVGGNVASPGSANTACFRDSDCFSPLRCVDFFGELMCRMSLDEAPSLACDRSSDCPSGQACVYRIGSGRLVCMWTGEGLSGPSVGGNVRAPALPAAQSLVVGGNVSPAGPTVGGNIKTLLAIPQDDLRENSVDTVSPYKDVPEGKDAIIDSALDSDSSTASAPPIYDVMRPAMEVPKQSLIDPAATPCEFDYQCRMGESCSGVIAMVDRNVTVCQYDVTKENRLCIYHADCLQGQMCSRNATGSFVCQSSLAAALGDTSCLYDYECSGGARCESVGNDHEKKFRCRQPQFADPRRNQHCLTNAQCPYQQVCRHVSGVSMCIDVGSTAARSQGVEIQRKLFDFVHDLIFAKS